MTSRKKFYGLAGRRCILIGGGGFIGINLCKMLVSNGVEVIIVSPHVLDEGALAGATWIRAMLIETNKYIDSIQEGDYVIHMASTTVPATSNVNPIADISHNVLPTLKLLEILSQKRIARLVFLSSGGTVYGKSVLIPTTEDAPTDPICSYGIHKLTIEKYLSMFRILKGFDSVVLRISNPFGPYQTGNGQGVIAVIISKALKGETITIWGDGSIVRDYIFVSDVAEAIFRAAVIDNAEVPKLFNIGSGEGRSIQQILETVQSIHDRPLKVTFDLGRATDVPVSILDIKRARQYLNWHPEKEWNEAMVETYEWVSCFNKLITKESYRL